MEARGPTSVLPLRLDAGATQMREEPPAVIPLRLDEIFAAGLAWRNEERESQKALPIVTLLSGNAAMVNCRNDEADSRTR